MPGKGASIAIIDTLETPIVRLKDGNVVRVKDAEHAASLVTQLDQILYLGDILISFGDFLENNHKLVPSAYVEEWWAQEFDEQCRKRYSSLESGAKELEIEEVKLSQFTKSPLYNFPTFSQALAISKIMQVPLHPRYLRYWDQLSTQEIINLRKSLAISENQSFVSLRASISLKPSLEKLGVEHSLLSENELIITGLDAEIVSECLDLKLTRNNEIPSEGWVTSTELVSKLAAVEIKNKSSTFVGVRVGRPEKAMPRKMRPPVQGLFPVGKSTGMSRDILIAADNNDLALEIVNLECPTCNTRSITAKCPLCQSDTTLFKVCVQCGMTSNRSSETRCARCGGNLRYSSSFKYPNKR